MTLQERLGFSADTRLLISHADDIGMCQATVSAWQALVETGLLSAASTMVPCSWFPATVKAEQALGDKADLGVHLTLTCEWPDYRWSALTTSDPQSGFVDAEGYLPRLARAVHLNVDLDAVRAEITAQLERALNRGMDVTHIDSHMFSLYHPRLMPLMLELAAAHRLPVMIADYDAAQVAERCVIPLNEAEIVAEQCRAAAARGEALLVSSLICLPFHQYLEASERMQWVTDWLDTRGPGVHVLIGHPATDTPELRAIARDYQTRVADLLLFGSEAFRKALDERGFKLIGMRQIREALRGMV